MRYLFLILFVHLVLVGRAQAHFLWIAAESTENPEAVCVYFSETAVADDPALLQKFSDLKVISLSTGHNGMKQQAIELKDSDEALRGELPQGTTLLAANRTFGVVKRGGETFLLKYHAKAYPSVLPGTWNAIDDFDLAELEVTPLVSGQELVLNVTWRGTPASHDQVTIEGPGLAEKIQGATDSGGRFHSRLPASGFYSIRARHIESVSGEFENENYTSVRHYATLTLPYSAPTILAETRVFPELPQGITSFGAAIANDAIYVYGGHFGEAHHYSTSGQSNEFRRLSLTSPDAIWEELPSGPKLTGLAMVSYGEKLYRVGGFTVKNSDDEPQNLWSQEEFAVFDPATNVWTDLPSLPEPRSSHDAVVVNGKLYVIGGWNIAGPDQTTWHHTAWVCDLTQPKLEWTSLPTPPFQRRALSLAALEGKIYVLGGMQESGGPTTRVDIFDPESGQWSQGPALHGTGMEGFGSSAFSLGNRLIVTTMSGSAQQLSPEKDRWEIVGQLKFPRFFHRQLTTPSNELLVVGGANMQTGKTNSLEIFRLMNGE